MHEIEQAFRERSDLAIGAKVEIWTPLSGEGFFSFKIRALVK
jgi:hypothetical protein